MLDATPLIFPQLGPVYQALFPWAEALLRAVVGFTLVPHGLRSTFGMFPSTGAQSHNLTEFADELDRGGYHPGRFWARAIVLTNQKGAVLELSGRQIGLMANADLSGLAITMR